MCDMELFAYHNSRISDYRLPQGALRCSERAVLSLCLWGSDAHLAGAVLRLWADESERLIPGVREAQDDGFRFRFELAAPEKPQLIWYYFIIELEGKKLYYGARSGVGRISDSIPEDYQITCFDADFSTPEWFRNAIVYQIFPDRFRRGGADSEGRTAFDRADFHRSMGRRLRIHGDWSSEPEYLPEPGARHYLPNDYFGGDLRGIIEKLPYLAGLGVSAIYLNPIFEAASNHRYNTSDYLSIDPILGTEYDYRELVNIADSLGISIILDGVFSHTGDDSRYFNKYGRYEEIGAYESRSSPYYKWYDFRHFPDDYRCWCDFTTVPEVNALEESYVEFIRSVIRKWTQLGARGWRLDVADELPDEFIRLLRSELKGLKRDALLLGEVWEDASNKTWQHGIREYVNGFELDSVMNYPFRDAVCDFLIGRCDAFALNEVLAGQQERYPQPFYRACMNVLSTHDTQRLLSVLGGAPGKDELSRDAQAKFLLDEAQLGRGKRLQRLAAVLQYSMPQPPCIYYADEAGMTGLMDPFNRRSYPWGHEDESLIEFYTKLGKLRRQCTALCRGEACFLPVNENVFAVYRKFEERSSISIINRAEVGYDILLRAGAFREGGLAPNVKFAENYASALDGERICVHDDMLRLRLEPISAAVLVNDIGGDYEE